MQRNTAGFNRLQLARNEGQAEVASELLRIDMLLSTVTSTEASTALHHAVISGRIEILKNHLKHTDKELIMAANRFGWTALHGASDFGRQDLCRELVSKGGLPLLPSVTNRKQSALRCAAMKGHSHGA